MLGRAAAYAAARREAVREQLRTREARAITIGLLGACVLLLAGLGVWIALFATTPSVERLGRGHVAEATIAYTADGQELTRYHLQNRTWVPLEAVSPHVVEALLATEDHRFYHHAGIDLPRVFGAALGTAAGQRQGGSTITMQLARNVFADLRDDALLVRKAREWVTALRIESAYTKDEILELYLNAVPFMYDAFGIEAAAKTYFQKSAAELDVAESATLVGLLKGTVLYNPVRHPERSHARRNVVLQQMVRHDYLTPEAYAELREAPTQLRFRRLTRNDNLAPYFAEYVRQWLGEWAEENDYNLYTDGLRVYTTLDGRLQEAAEAAVAQVGDELQAVVDAEWGSASPYFSYEAANYVGRTEDPFAYFWERHPAYLDEFIAETDSFRTLTAGGLAPADALDSLRADTAFVAALRAEHQRLKAGFVAVDPKTGHVRAWVGGRDFEQDEFDHVALARRQPGSTFKPFVYAAALENGYAPYSQLCDCAVNYVDPYTKVRWNPGNFGGTSGAYLTLSQALAHSKNTITARLITDIGADKVVDLAHRAGVESDLLAVPSLGLGTSEVTLLELTAAYATLADQGRRHAPVAVTRIENRSGEVLATFGSEPAEALPPHVAYAVVDMMRGGVDFGTAQRMRHRFGARGDLAAKTGTTQGGADGWFMLVHPDLVVGAWIGFTSPKMTFRSTYWGQGAHTALHVTGDFYRRVRQQHPALLSPDAAFTPVPSPGWGNRGRTGADDLNRRERRENGLGKILERLRNTKG